MFKTSTKTVTINGRELKFETGKIARQAKGAVTLTSGETLILGTACRTEKAADDVDFFPLRVDYQAKFSGAGKTLGGFIKREGRPKESEILVCRLIDRPLRPLFPDGYYNEVQVLTYVLSYDGVHSPDPLAICAASAALTLSDIPLIKPVGAVRVGMIDGTFIINPTNEEIEVSRLDLMLAGTQDAILMIEGYADFLSEEQLLQAVEEGHEAIKQICTALLEWQEEIGQPKVLGDLRLPSEKLIKEIEKDFAKVLEEKIGIADKKERETALSTLSEEIIAKYAPKGEEQKYPITDIKIAYKNLQAKVMRRQILKTGKRIDGRSCDEIRPISIEMSLLPRTHGSALFTRGETQALAVCTLGGESMGQRFETLDEDGISNFYLQYSFPPFSVGEVGRLGAPGRREIGHGKLAERSLSLSVPSKDKFPYTIRLESNITESNGSSSMASVCGGTLALMDAGVPIKHPVAGIAMGLILEGDHYAILSDILGAEDALGDMDFKVAGNATGITAFQLDIKIEGITPKIMQVALAQAKQGRVHILKKMQEACPHPTTQLSKYAPRIETVRVKPSKIGAIIGPGGKMIRQIVEESGAEIDINDEGIVSIVSSNAESMAKAKEMIHNLTAEVEEGQIYEGTIASIMPFGVFVTIYSQDGLCHISQLSHERLEESELPKRYKEGQKLKVKVLEIDDRGKIRLSHKVLLPKPQKEKE